MDCGLIREWGINLGNCNHRDVMVLAVIIQRESNAAILVSAEKLKRRRVLPINFLADSLIGVSIVGEEVSGTFLNVGEESSDSAFEKKRTQTARNSTIITEEAIEENKCNKDMDEEINRGDKVATRRPKYSL